MIKRLYCLLLTMYVLHTASAQQFITSRQAPEAFTISSSDIPSIYVDLRDDWLVQKAASLLQEDIALVTGKKPALIHQLSSAGKQVILVGSLRGCEAIRQLVKQKTIDVRSIKDQWEAFQLNSLPALGRNGKNMLVITGSDKRGTAFGVFELSRQLGVSPWYWWADVAAKKKTDAYVPKGTYPFLSPSVKYRGIFINDEAPAFSGWAREKFGGINHQVYEKIFELLLRLKANYLWPAMWGNAFNDDDTLSPILADKWGIVMGTSHHEPMQRSQQEWKRYGKGEWDYTKNEAGLKAFWTEGIRNMGIHESIVTMGMRGDGDMAMTEGTATNLLEKIVSDQRKIISAVTGKAATQIPQLWALYKEVQNYYDAGMRVPDDVTLLLCDDNWGNIRRLPKPGTPKRSGGYGIYYHFDYVGGPRNYKWINTNNISRVWEQMHLAYAHGADRIWIVNVGDLKPMELPVSFFLDYAYNISQWNEDNIGDYYSTWAAEQFGREHASAIGDILKKYAQYAARRKPELLDANTYNLNINNEFEGVVQQWVALRKQSEELNNMMAPADRDAFFQLVLHPVQALENLHQLYYAVAMNKRYAALQNPAANEWAHKTKQYYIADSLLSVRYNTGISGGKWNHMMDQTHIGYSYWQEPRKNIMPAVTYVTEKGPAAVKRVFEEKAGYISISAANYSRASDTDSIHWKVIPGIGKNGDGITSFPVTTSVSLSANSPHLEYEIVTSCKDSIVLRSYFSPTLNIYHSNTGLRFAVSIDDEAPQVISLNKEDDTGAWNRWVADNNIIKQTRHMLTSPGKHMVRYWMIDAGVVLQQLVIQAPNASQGYLAPSETLTNTK